MSKIIKSNITGTLPDRAFVNHATVLKLNDIWKQNIPLIEKNCHLNPLDSIATKVKNKMTTYQNKEKIKCLEATTIHKIS